VQDYETLLLLARKLKEVKKQVGELQSRTETVQKLEGPKGKDGLDGRDGRDGKDGKDGLPGKDGKDGLDGKNGVSVVDAYVAADSSLVLKLSDGTEIDVGTFLSESLTASVTRVQRAAGPNIYVQSEEPANPQPGDLWFTI
jgi:hypothetical protein